MSDLQNQNNQAVSMGDWIITLLISYVPIIGFIMLLVWAFGGGAKESKRNYARAILIVSIVLGVIGGIIGAIFGASFAAIIANMPTYS